MPSEIKLTQFSHGAGCGCKIAPNILETILYSQRKNLMILICWLVTRPTMTLLFMILAMAYGLLVPQIFLCQ